MSKMIFVNLPVKDIERSRKFFSELGYSFNPQFSDENAACMVISDTIFAMLLREPFFKGFSQKEIPDTATSAQVLLCVSADTRAEVDEIADRAIELGGKASGQPITDGPMYGRAFEDPDGHIWELMWMDPSALEGQEA